MNETTALTAALKRLQRWCTIGLCSESAIEAVILIDLFHDALGFNKVSSEHLKSLPGGGQPDIVLRPSKTAKVVIEVKKPNFLDKPKTYDYSKNFVDAIQQAASYVRKLEQEFGIVTDGTNWTYFLVPRNDDQHIYRLVSFNIKQHPVIARKVLSRSKKGTIMQFLNVLATIHRDMDKKKFDKLMNKGLTQRVQQLISDAELADVKVDRADRAAVRALYDSSINYPNQVLRLNFVPLNLPSSFSAKPEPAQQETLELK